VSQPLFFSRFADLMLALGDQDPELGKFERSIQPVVLVGDGRELVPPLLAPRSFCGGAKIGGGTVATHAALQLRATAPGGISAHINMTSNGTLPGFIWRLVTAPLAIAGLVTGNLNVEVAPGAGMVCEMGTINATTFGADEAAVNLTTNVSHSIEVVIPNQTVLEMVSVLNNSSCTWHIRGRNLQDTSTL